MKTFSVYQFKSYKSWLENLFSAPENRGLMAEVCRRIDCQRSYLSRVLNSKLQLTPDSAYKISKALRLERDEQEYFLLLVDTERCSDPEYKQFLQQKLHKLKVESAEIRTKIARPEPESIFNDVLYFSSWHWVAIHLWCSTPGNHTVESLARKFSLAPETVGSCLESLLQKGFLEKHGRNYQFVKGSMHVDRHSPLAHWNHSNWRQKALQDAQLNRDRSLHFTNVQTMSRTDFLRIRNQLLDWIEKAEEVARPSPAEDLAAFCIDAFLVEPS